MIMLVDVDTPVPDGGQCGDMDGERERDIYIYIYIYMEREGCEENECKMYPR